MSSLAKALPRRAQEARRFMSLQRRQSLVGIGFVLPAVVFFAIFNFYAIGYALYLSFTSWDLLTPPRWIGFANYTALLSDRISCRHWVSRFATRLKQLSRWFCCRSGWRCF